MPQYNNYGVIGNQTSSALLSCRGAIEWLCWPYLDSPAHFTAVSDESHGGKFQIMPLGEFHSEQQYLYKTNIIETIFETPHGRGTLIDWMPIEPNGVWPILYRKIQMIQGKMDWIALCAPSFSYGSHATHAEQFRGGVLFRGTQPDELAHLRSQVPFKISTGAASASASFLLEAEQTVWMSWVWGRPPLSALEKLLFKPEIQLKETIQYWRSNTHRCPPSNCPFAGPWHDAIERSTLVLKLFTTPYAGSLAESVLAYLPGTVGTKTWDHRYSPIQNSSSVLSALEGLGYRDEAKAYFSWLSDILLRDGAESLHPIYALDGGRVAQEREFNNLGFSEFRPIRIGSQTFRKFQLSIYCHVILAAVEYFKIFKNLPSEVWSRISETAEFIRQAWRRPDFGRDPAAAGSRPEHHVVSKLLCWAALDRAHWLACEIGMDSPVRWKQESEILHRTICDQGYDSKQNSFVRAFGEVDLDPHILIALPLKFLPADDPRIISTLDSILSRCSNGVLIRDSYAAEAHFQVSFLTVSALAESGRIDEASDRLAELCTYATRLGLFADGIDLRTGELVGNFPSCPAHLAFVEAAANISKARIRRHERVVPPEVKTA